MKYLVIIYWNQKQLFSLFLPPNQIHLTFYMLIEKQSFHDWEYLCNNTAPTAHHLRWEKW